ncbi:MAG: class I SAM-dependent methyltransferase [Vulcanimicrobiota bacterium]
MHIQPSEFRQKYDQDRRGDTDLHDQVYYNNSRPKFFAIVEAMAGLPEPKTVLEIGTSRFSRQLKQLCPHWDVHTLDLGTRHQEVSESAAVKFFCGDVLQPLPTPSDFYDLIIFSEVIEHLQGNPRLALRHLLRVLRPGGRLLLTTPNLVRLLNRVKMALGRPPVPEVGPPEWWGGHMREYTYGEIYQMLAQEGFDQIEGGPHLYWDGIRFYMQSGPFHHNEKHQLVFRRRFGGWKIPIGLAYSMTTNLLARWSPSLRHGMLVVARRPL